MSLKNIIFGDHLKFTQENYKPTLIFLMAALIPTLFHYFGSREFYVDLVNSENLQLKNSDLEPVIYLFVTGFILMGMLPFIVMKYIFKESHTGYGLQIGDWKSGLKSTAILIPVIAIFLLFPSAFQKEFNTFYPLYKSKDGFDNFFILYEFLRLIFYYFAWEYFYRGFILFGLRSYIGNWNAILVQMIPSCLWHIGYPTGEILGAIPGGILFGILAIRTNSIFWPLLLHWLIGVLLDVFIILIN